MVQGLVWGLGFIGLGFRVWASGFGLGFRIGASPNS